jgi:hypothetical protein
MATNSTPAKSLGEIALASALKAVQNDDSAAFTATVALGLVMANRQVEKAEADSEITEKANKATFRMFLKRYAARGNVVWRDTQHMVDGFMALKGKDREKAISDYIDRGKNAGDFAKPEKARLGDGVAKLRTYESGAQGRAIRQLDEKNPYAHYAIAITHLPEDLRHRQRRVR